MGQFQTLACSSYEGVITSPVSEAGVDPDDELMSAEGPPLRAAPLGLFLFGTGLPRPNGRG